MDKFARYFAFTLSAVGLAVLGLATAGLGVAGETAAPPSHKVTICHATNSATNPYVAITVDVSSAGEAQSLHGHREHSDDVIPAFVYDGVTYPGQGDQSILANGCNGSQTTSTESTATESTTTPTESTTASTESTTTEQTTTLVTTEETTTTQNTPTTDAPVSTSGTTTTTIQTPPTSSGQLGVTTEVSTTNPGTSTAPAATTATTAATAATAATATVPFTPPGTKSPGVERKSRVQAEEITRTRLPFTGAPLWEFAFAGALLLAGGFLVLTWKK